MSLSALIGGAKCPLAEGIETCIRQDRQAKMHSEPDRDHFCWSGDTVLLCQEWISPNSFLCIYNKNCHRANGDNRHLVPDVPIALGRDIRDMSIACARSHPDANKHTRHIPMYRPVHSAHANKCPHTHTMRIDYSSIGCNTSQSINLTLGALISMSRRDIPVCPGDVIICRRSCAEPGSGLFAPQFLPHDVTFTINWWCQVPPCWGNWRMYTSRSSGRNALRPWPWFFFFFVITRYCFAFCKEWISPNSYLWIYNKNYINPGYG